MSLADRLVSELEIAKRYFETTTGVLEPEDASFAPEPGMFTVAGQIAHVADSAEWFLDGAFGPGWDLDFDASVAGAKAVTDLEEAREWFGRAFRRCIGVVGAASDDQLSAPIPDERIMKGAPRSAIVNGIVDHTAHHRGSLAVYARLLGKTPPMPYG